MKTLSKLVLAVGLLVGTASSHHAFAGKGGSAQLIQQAVDSKSVDAIIAEVEKTEGLMCEECIQLVTNLTEDSRYKVREVAAWWFGKRPALAEALTEQFVDSLQHGDSVAVRNAADFLGTTKAYTALPQLRAAIDRGGMTPEARLALVRAAGVMAHTSGNYILQRGMQDSDPAVRVAAVEAWRDVLHQTDGTPAVALLSDRDQTVRQAAAAVVGGMRVMSARASLEILVTQDGDPNVRRNAAWALGQLGQAASRDALTKAARDPSGLVNLTAKAALARLR